METFCKNEAFVSTS